MAVTPADALLTDRVALVTGAAAGIGRSTAVGLASFGADLVVCDRDADGLDGTAAAVEAAGRRCSTAVLDVRDDEPTRAWVAAAAADHGRLDIVVNNVGGTFQALAADLTPGGRDALIAENFTSALTVVQAASEHLRSGASVINLTSVEAHRAGPGYAVYAAMKAALTNLTASLAVELGWRGIRVNCVAPDLISTPGVGDMGMRAPLARAGVPDDVAGAVIFLAGDLARFVTGRTLHVDGGTAAAGGWHRDGRGDFVVASSVHSP